MSLGLILINEEQTNTEAVAALIGHNTMLSQLSSSYIVCTKTCKEQLTKLVRGHPPLSSIIYDVINDEDIVINSFEDFKVLLDVKGSKLVVTHIG